MDVTPDDSGLDVTPREAAPRSHRRWPAVVVAVLLVGALGFVVARGLSDATLFFKNADEAVAERDELGDDRFRLQGTVVPGSVTKTPTGATFTVVYNRVEVDVVHAGAPPELFQESVPVVVEGHWGDDAFESDRILVKHSEVYEEEHTDRLREAESQGIGGAESP